MLPCLTCTEEAGPDRGDQQVDPVRTDPQQESLACGRLYFIKSTEMKGRGCAGNWLAATALSASEGKARATLSGLVEYGEVRDDSGERHVPG